MHKQDWPRILIIGAGPIGGIIGGRLFREGEDVTLVDVDEAHLRAIRLSGLRVEVPDGTFTVPIPARLPGEVSGRYDIGCIAVRSHVTRAALATLLPHLKDEAVVVSLQNGINAPVIEEAVGPDRTLAATIRMMCQRTAPGVVSTPARGKIYLGHLSGRITPNLQKVHALLGRAMPTGMEDNILGIIWGKLTYTSIGYFWGLADQSFRITSQSARIRRQCVEFFGEMVAVGRAAGVRFTPIREYDPLDYHPDRPFAERLAGFEKMLADPSAEERTGPPGMLKRWGRTEVDYTVGHVVAEGRRLGIPTPQCARVLGLFHELEAGTRRMGMHNYDELPAPAQ